MIYNRVAESFARFGVREDDLAGPPEAAQGEIFARARKIGTRIHDTCGAPGRPAHQEVMFSGLMIATARLRRDGRRVPATAWLEGRSGSD